MPKIRTENLEIGYEKAGTGPPVILIPGLGYGRWLWDQQLEGLSDSFTLYALDNRGLGESEAPDPPYTIADMARDVRDFIRALDIKKAHVGGCSLGGFVAQVFGLEYPQMTDRLFLVSTTGGGGGATYASTWTMFRLSLARMKKDLEKRSRARLRLTLAPNFIRQKPEEVEAILQRFLNQPSTAHGVRAQLQAGQNFWRRDHRWTALHRMRAPVLVVTGDKDRIVPPVNSERLAQELPRASLEVIENSGHLPMLEKPEKFNQLLSSFLQD